MIAGDALHWARLHHICWARLHHICWSLEISVSCYELLSNDTIRALICDDTTYDRFPGNLKHLKHQESIYRTLDGWCSRKARS